MKYLLTLIFPSLFFFCNPGDNNQSSKNITDYPIKQVDVKDVKLDDTFWLPIIRRVQNVTIDYALKKCEEEGRMENFLIAGGVLEGETRGYMPFDDTDLYKIIEGASYSLISNPDKQLDAYLDTLISIIETGQEADGYLTTWRTINGMKPPASWVRPGQRWEHLAASHELYNSGHMFEAAEAHYRATGKRSFLDIAIKNADLLVDTFGPGKLELLPGHQIVETGLIKLYRITGNVAYLDLSRYFLDQRGDSTTHELFGAYSQDHLPVVLQDEVVGHAVRAVYMFAAMTDIAALQNDTDYMNAVNKLWENMVFKKMYITGGIGSRHEGEAFGENYDLPNLTAYSETCAAIGSVDWNHRLFLLTGDVKYCDVMERTLFNGLISGMSLDGSKFFYPNALESDGEYLFNQGACTRKSWFDCSCCPTNLIRFLPSMPKLIYATNQNDIYINLYVANTAEIDLEGRKINIRQITNYPWDGDVKISVEPEHSQEFTIKLRIPGWARNEVLPGDLYAYENPTQSEISISVNGTIIRADMESGYINLNRKWQKGDTIQLELPMNVQMVRTNEKVEGNLNKRSVEAGPLVYCVEEIDNPGIVGQLSLSNKMTWDISWDSDLLDGINLIRAIDASGMSSFTAIPYYAWSNRGIGKMKVWLPYSE